MNIPNIKIKERILDYVNKLIFNPLTLYNHLKLDEYDIKQLTVIVQDAFENRKSIQNLASSFGHYTKNWNIDWHWIAYHIISDYYNIKQAQSFLKMYGANQEVYKSISNSHSPDCLALYLTERGNRKSEPKIFTLSELVANGSNLGIEKKDWKPVVGVTDFGTYRNSESDEIEHYYDNSSLVIKSKWEKWDAEKGCYKLEDLPLTERRKK